MILPPFEYYRPETVDEALQIAAGCDGDFDYIAGGSDLLQNYKNRLNPRGHVISLTAIEEMQGASSGRLGGLTLLADVERNGSGDAPHPAVKKAASLVASPLVRQQATVGGNLLVETRCFYFNQTEFWRRSMGYCMKAEGDVCLVVPQKEKCYATYSGDLAPVFMVLDATYHLAGPGGRRSVAARDFYRGDGIERNVKKPEEILTHVTIPEASASLAADYGKLRIRDTLDYPMMSVAAALRLNGNRGDRVEELQIVVNAIDTRPMLFDDYTASLAGRTYDETFIEEVSHHVRDASRPVKNLVLSTAYRKKMIGVYLARLLRGFQDGR